MLYPNYKVKSRFEKVPVRSIPDIFTWYRQIMNFVPQSSVLSKVLRKTGSELDLNILWGFSLYLIELKTKQLFNSQLHFGNLEHGRQN